MSTMNVGEAIITVDQDGFLTNADQWSPDVAKELASAANIALTDRHWAVINFCREDYTAKGEAPGVRRITKVAGIPTKEMYALFPGGPGKLAAKLSGLPKPTSCV